MKKPKLHVKHPHPLDPRRSFSLDAKCEPIVAGEEATNGSSDVRDFALVDKGRPALRAVPELTQILDIKLNAQVSL
jgi:hypothetical protein